MAASKELKAFDISTEAWREYDFMDRFSGVQRVYRIIEPVTVVIYDGSTTHRVIDSQGIVHIVPAIGCCQCVLRCTPKPGEKHIVF